MNAGERRRGAWNFLLPLAAIGLLIIIMLAPRWFAGGRPAVFADLTLDEARAKATADGRLLVIDYWASWCPPCVAMDRTTWTDPAVIAWLTDHAVAVQIDIDAHAALAAAARVNAIPLVIVERNGEVLERLSGLQEPPALLAALRRLR